jgi:hypothetical protein
LPEDSIVAVTTLIDFMYRGVVPDFPAQAAAEGNAEAVDYARGMCEAYILGEKICYDDFMNRLLDSMVVSWGDLLRVMCMLRYARYVYENTHPESRLRRYLALVGASEHVEARSIVEEWKNEGSWDSTDSEIADWFTNSIKHIPELCVDILRNGILRSQDVERWAIACEKGAIPAIESDGCYFHMHTTGETCHLAEVNPTTKAITLSIREN